MENKDTKTNVLFDCQLFFQTLNYFSLNFVLRVDHQYNDRITLWCLAAHCREAVHCICLFLYTVPMSSISLIHRKQNPDRFPSGMFFPKVFSILKKNV